MEIFSDIGYQETTPKTIKLAYPEKAKITITTDKIYLLAEWANISWKKKIAQQVINTLLSVHTLLEHDQNIEKEILALNQLFNQL